MKRSKVYVTCLACCLCWLGPSYSQEPPSPAESQPIKLLVTAVNDKGELISGLSPADIRLTEDGRPQALSDFRAQLNAPTAVAVMIDTSSSQSGIFPLTKSTARVFVKGFIRPGRDQVSIVAFASAVNIAQPLTDDVELLRAAIDKLEAAAPANPVSSGNKPPKGQKPVGSTGLWDAVIFTCEKVLPEASADTRKAIVIFTDGDDTSSRAKIKDAVVSAAKHDVAIYAIGLPTTPDDSPTEIIKIEEGEKLRRLSEETGGRAYFPAKNEELESILSQIDHDLRVQYVVSFLPNHGTGRGSDKRLKIEVLSPERKEEKIRLAYRRTY